MTWEETLMSRHTRRHAFRVYWRAWLGRYVRKMRGLGRSNARPELREALTTFMCAFAGVGFLAWLAQIAMGATESAMLIPPFGASALMVFGAPHSPFAQPRNVIGGHVLSALIGISAFHLLGDSSWAAALAVAAAGALMHLTTTMHPPGGATALLAVIGDARIQGQGYAFAFVPVGAGTAIIVLTAVAINNLVLHRQYPTHWR
jgi:CBS-domain-containing membrane protein